MDIKPLLVQGFIRKTYESKGGKLQYAYKSETIGDRKLANGQRKEDRGIVRISSALVSYNDKKFESFDKAVQFVAGLNQTIALRIKAKMDELNLEVATALDEWATKVKPVDISDEDIITKLIAGDRVFYIMTDKEVGFTVELQTLTVEEEIRTTEGFTTELMANPEVADNYRLGVLGYGVRSINGVTFKDPTTLTNAIDTMPYAMLSVLYNWHLALANRVRKALEDDGNF